MHNDMPNGVSIHLVSINDAFATQLVLLHCTMLINQTIDIPTGMNKLLYDHTIIMLS